MEKFIVGALVLFLALFLLFGVPAIHNRERSDIARWASENHYTVLSEDVHAFDTGPYVFTKHTTFWRVEVRDHRGTVRYFWFRFGWKTDVEEYDR